MLTSLLLKQLETEIAAYAYLDADHPLVVARDGILLLDTTPHNARDVALVIEFAVCVLAVYGTVQAVSGELGAA